MKKWKELFIVVGGSDGGGGSGGDGGKCRNHLT